MFYLKCFKINKPNNEKRPHVSEIPSKYIEYHNLLLAAPKVETAGRVDGVDWDRGFTAEPGIRRTSAGLFFEAGADAVEDADAE